MKPFTKDILRSLRRPVSRFLAIFAIVGLGAGFFAGLRATSADMRASGDAYFDRSNFMDFRLLSTLGFTQADVDAVRQAAGVQSVMASHTADVLTKIGGMEQAVQIHALPKGASAMNRVTLLSGRLPRAAGECVIGARRNSTSVKLGDILVVSPGGGSQKSALKQDRYKVVGIVSSPLYIAFNLGTTTIGTGQLSYYMYIRDADFNQPVFTELFVTARGAAAANTYDSTYDKIVSPVKSTLESLAKTRQEARFDALYNEGKSSLDKAKDEYARSKSQADAALAQASEKLADAADGIFSGQTKLAGARRQLAQGQTALAQGQSELAAKQKQADVSAAALGANEAQYQAGLTEWQAASDSLTARKAQTEQQLAQLKALIGSGLPGAPANEAEYERMVQAAEEKLSAAQKELDSRKAALDASSAALEKGKRGIAAARAALEAGRKTLLQKSAQLAAAQKEIDGQVTALAAARQSLAQGKAAYDRQKANAERELASAAQKIEDGEASLGKLSEPAWYVLGRHDNVGFEGFGKDAGRIDSISTLFPLLFFLVAALVALTTMTRMVEEERVLIGTYKALGFGDGKIASKYLLYAALASAVGSAGGIAVGLYLFPAVIWAAYQVLYIGPALVYPPNPGIVLLSGGASVACTLLATWAACRATLFETPAALMLPRAPKPGKRILLERMKPVWVRLSFIQKVTVRNLFRYKKRFWMTVIGIAGCTGLLLTGFGLNDSVSEILSRQFDLIDKYDTSITLSGGGVSGGLQKLLDNRSNFAAWQRVYLKQEDVKTGGGTVSAYLYVPENAARLSAFINLRDRRSGRPVAFGDDSVVLTEKLAKQLGVKAGDSVTIRSAAGKPVALRVTGVTENYIYHYVYVAPRLYKSLLGEVPDYNGVQAVCMRQGAAVRQALQNEALSQADVATYVYTADLRDRNQNMVHSVNMVVLVLIISAAMLAFIVLYNLTNINVTERVREIATIKVLGFYDGEVNAYIYRETILLTLIGCVLGLGLGVLMNSFVVRTAEIDMVMFGRVIKPASFLWSAALTLVFSVLVDLVMYRKLQRIDMVESLKSVD